METADAARRWGDTWRDRWPARDLEAVAALYHADVTCLVFDDAGLVIEQRDTWNQARGRLSPPEGRGR